MIAQIEGLTVPVVDRAIFEKLFEVRRRRAIQLMHYFGGHQVGRTFVIDRGALLDRLRVWNGSEHIQREQTRRLRIAEELDRVGRLAAGRKVQIQVTPKVRHNQLSDLPSGIHLRPGELRIEFFGTEDLLRQLYQLSQAILSDYKKFEAICESS